MQGLADWLSLIHIVPPRKRQTVVPSLCNSLKRDFFFCPFFFFFTQNLNHAFKTLLPSQAEWIYTTRPLAVRLMVCAEVPGAKKLTLLPELLFEFALSRSVTTFHKSQLTYPWCCLQLIGKYLALQCASHGDYYCHHHLRFVFECSWNMGNNGQPLLCSSHVVLVAWVQFCQYYLL